MLTLWMVMACGAGTEDEAAARRLDRDRDGVLEALDCDDEDADVGAPYGWHADYDGDGHGDPEVVTEGCRRPELHVVGADDCDDANNRIHPGAVEYCDGIDNDCDGAVDDGGDRPYYLDLDGDGYGDPATVLAACAPPVGYTDNADDCDDADPELRPGAVEICDGLDNNCDGHLGVDESDDDGDGWRGCEGDCDDAPGGEAVSPGTSEICGDGVDNDCDAVVDEGIDADADGWASCSDCQDDRPSVHPGAAEICGDGLDNDCDGGGGACDGLHGERDIADGARVYLGEQSGGALGASAAIVEGWVVLGEPWLDESGEDSGAVHLYPAGELDGDVTLFGEGRDERLGTALAAGDLDGDGVRELLIGAPTDGDDGAVWLVGLDAVSSGAVGQAGVALTGETGGEAGGAIAIPGDMSGDGRTDALIGGTGGAWVVAGPVVGGALRDSAARLLGDGDAGSAVAGGDLDGDGVMDAVVGAPGAGEVGIFQGPLSGSLSWRAAAVLRSDIEGEGFGVALAVGDLDGDGYADLAVGGAELNGLGDQSGAVHWYTGGAGALAAAGVMIGESPRDNAGYRLAAGDLSGDGVDDLLVGAPGADRGEHADVGAVYAVVLPATGRWSLGDAALRVRGEGDYDAAGSGLAVPGDVDGDGSNELLIGAPRSDAGDYAAGAAWLITGGIGL